MSILSKHPNYVCLALSLPLFLCGCEKKIEEYVSTNASTDAKIALDGATTTTTTTTTTSTTTTTLVTTISRSLSDSLSSGFAAKNYLANTSLDISGLSPGDAVAVYSDSACATAVGIASYGGTVTTVSVPSLSTNKLYSFYLKVTDSSSRMTNCMAANSTYQKVKGYVVDTTSNVNVADAMSSDGTCATGANQCTVKAAIDSALFSALTEEVIVDIPDGTYNLTAGLGVSALMFSNPITITGRTNTILNGSGMTSPILSISGTPSGNMWLTLKNITIQGAANTADSFAGGGVSIKWFYGTSNNRVSIENCNFVSNSTIYRGGGLYIWGNWIDIKHTKFDGNRLAAASFGEGPAFYVNNSNNITFDDIWVTNHSINPTWAVAIVSTEYSSNVSFNAISITDNTVPKIAFDIYSCRDCEIKNSTIANNAGRAMSISNHATTGSFTVKNVTAANNGSAYPTQTGLNLTGNAGTNPFILVNNIFYLSSGTGTNSDFTGTGVLTVSNNIINDNSHGFGAGATNVNPQLLALSSNGGLGKSMLLSAASPAIDSGSNTYCSSADQLGQSRPRNGGTSLTCDIGAVEY